jgi:hypothetical protein
MPGTNGFGVALGADTVATEDPLDDAERAGLHPGDAASLSADPTAGEGRHTPPCGFDGAAGAAGGAGRFNPVPASGDAGRGGGLEPPTLGAPTLGAPLLAAPPLGAPTFFGGGPGETAFGVWFGLSAPCGLTGTAAALAFWGLSAGVRGGRTNVFHLLASCVNAHTLAQSAGDGDGSSPAPKRRSFSSVRSVRKAPTNCPTETLAGRPAMGTPCA